MSALPTFICHHCHEVTGNPHTSLDRRVVHRRIEGGGSQAQVTLQITEAQELFTYCDIACWHGHEHVIGAQLQLKSTYPADGAVVSCSRCAAPVVRAMLHVVYTVTTMRLTDAPDSYIGQVLQDDDFAILCGGCEEPDFVPAMAAMVHDEFAA